MKNMKWVFLSVGLIIGMSLGLFLGLRSAERKVIAKDCWTRKRTRRTEISHWQFARNGATFQCASDCL